MATPEDLAANADYIRMADKYVEVGSERDSSFRTDGEAEADFCGAGAWRYQQQQLRQRRADRRRC